MDLERDLGDLDLDLEPDLDLLRYLPGLDGFERDRDLVLDLDLDLETGLEPDLEPPGLALLGGEGDLLWELISLLIELIQYSVQICNM